MATWRTGSRCASTHVTFTTNERQVCSNNKNKMLSLQVCVGSCRPAECGFLICPPQARNKTGQIGYVPEKYLQFPASNSLLSMLQSLATLDARSHTSSNSTEPELLSGCVNGDANSKLYNLVNKMPFVWTSSVILNSTFLEFSFFFAFMPRARKTLGIQSSPAIFFCL